MQAPARIIFAGTPDFAVPSLQALLTSGHDVVAVLTQPDRPMGRGRKVQFGPVKSVAIAAGLPVLQPEGLSGPAEQQQLAALSPDLMVVVAYGLLLPEPVLRIPRFGCVNVHASLLPRWRGASPIQSALLEGDSETGVSIMQMDAGLDTGPVYCSESVSVKPHESAAELHDRLAALGGRLLADSIDPILAGELHATAQPVTGVTYAGRIRKADSVIDWSATAKRIDQLIRAYNPWPVAQTSLDGKQLRCWAAYADDQSTDTHDRPGTVVGQNEHGIKVQTGKGILVLTQVQIPGRKRMAATEFAHARPLAGVVLGS